jgi:endoglucanase
MNNIEKLKKLTQLNAIASNEIQMTNYLKTSLKGEISADRLGSVIASIGAGKSIMISAPIDEYGLIVSQITSKGLIKFQLVGGILSKNVLNQQFLLTTKEDTFIGIMGSKPLMSQPKEELSKVDDFKSMYLDFGFKSQAEAFEKGVQIGDMITRYSPLVEVVNNRVVSKALDSRSQVYVLSRLIDNLNDLKVNLNAAFTVQHKMSMKGAKTASFKIEPEIAINLDTVETTDLVGDGSIELGAGPVIFFYDQGLIAHPKLRSFVTDLCKSEQIPFQEGFQLSGFGEGHYLQLSKLGAATLSIGIPIRHKNGHHEMIDLKDLENTEKLLKAFIESLDDQAVDNILYT